MKTECRGRMVGEQRGLGGGMGIHIWKLLQANTKF